MATAADWAAAQRSGRYTTSTRGRTLAEEGFVHASRADQWQGVLDRFYADVDEPLVLLAIDPDRLRAPVLDESVPGADSDETFPHVYGPVEVAAVLHVVPLGDGPTATRPPLAGAPGAAPTGASFSELFLAEMLHNLAIATVVLAVVVAGTLVGLALAPDWGPITGAAIGLVLGVLAVRAHGHRRRDEQAGGKA